MLGAKPNPLDRMFSAVEKVRHRLITACAALDNAGIPYAVVGGNAVAAWVATVDEAAVRNTRDVDVMIRRADLDAVRELLETAGFVYRHLASLDVFLDHADSNVRDSVHIVFAGEFVRQTEPVPNPGLDSAVTIGEIKVLDLESVVQIKLTANRDKDRTHIRDLIEVGLVDETWLDRLPAELSARLEAILADPNG